MTVEEYFLLERNKPHHGLVDIRDSYLLGKDEKRALW
jgi:hypothetical protein